MDLVDDDRATLLGAFLDLAARMRDGDAGEDATDGAGPGVDSAASPSPPLPSASVRDLLARWRRAGLRAFAADRDDATAAGVTPRTTHRTAGEATA